MTSLRNIEPKFVKLQHFGTERVTDRLQLMGSNTVHIYTCSDTIMVTVNNLTFNQ